MRRQFILVISFALLAGAPRAAFAQDQKPDDGPTVEESYVGGQPNRLPNEAQRDMVAAALARIEAKDLAGAKRIFSAQLAAIRRDKGTDSLQTADAITSFAVQLYKADHLPEALPYFRETVGAYRRAYGGDHPDVAVAEQDYSRMLVEATPGKPPVEAVEVLEDALRIRIKTLGLEDAETDVNLSLLGRLKGDPALTGGDPAKIEAAADLLRQAIALLPKARNKLAATLPDARFRLAELYARNDMVPQALAAFDAFLKGEPEAPGEAAEKIADILIGYGHKDAAHAVMTLHPLASG